MARRLTPTWLALVALLPPVAARCRADDILVLHAASGRTARAAADRILVRWRQPTDAPDLAALDVAAAADVLPDARLAVVHLAPGQTVDAALRRFRALPGVLAAEPDYVVRPAVSPNDPLWDDQCGMRRVQLPEAWTYQRGRPDVTIAILDTGVAYDHPDLAANLRRSSLDPPNGVDDDGNGLVDDFRGWDFADGDNDPHADRGDGVGLAHGTHVAGIASAVTGNHLGMAGAAWDCSYLPVRVINAFGIGYLSDVARGIEYATDQGCAVINLSLEGPFSRTIQAAIDYAYERGVVVCAAAGNTAQEFTADPATWTTPVCNDGDDPARQNRVIGVAAIGCDSVKLPVSNYGATYSFIDLTAPGRNTTSTWWPGDGYAIASGTSQAAPLVAGGAALLIAQHGRLGADAVTELLRGAAYDIDGENPPFAGKLGAGRADVHLAVLANSPGPLVGGSVEVMAAGSTTPVRAMPGTGVDVRIALRNLGAVAASEVRATLTSGDPRVIVKRAEALYGEIGAGQTGVSPTSYRLRVRSDVPQGTAVPLSLSIQAQGAGPWTEGRLTLPVGWDALGEPDNACTEAYPVQFGTGYEREIGDVLDHDWFSFPARAGKRYLVETKPRLSSSPQTALSIRQGDCGAEVLFVSGEGGPAQTEWVCPASGRYAVAVTGDDALWSGPYRFRIRAVGLGVAGPVEVTRVAVDDDEVGLSHGNGDGRADPGETVELRPELTNRGPLPLSGVSARLSASRQAVKVLSADASFPDLAPEGAAWPQAAYVVRIGPAMLEPTLPRLTLAVTAAEGAWDSDMRLPVGRAGAGEPDDVCSEGVLIWADALRHARAFEAAEDLDWFALDATAGVRYRLTTWPAGDPAVGTVLALHGLFCGAPLAFGSAAPGRLAETTWLCPESGRYGIVVRPAPGSSLGPYEFSARALDNLGPGEPDDSCEQATELTVDGPPTLRDFGVPGDRDWFRFAAVDGATYVVETGPAPGQTPRTAKSPPDGAPRPPDTALKLCEPDCGARLAWDDDGGEGLFSRLAFSAPVGGDFSVRVTEVDGQLGAYQVWVRRDRAPTLSFTGESGYESDPVQPQAGAADETRFGFAVLYSDPDGDPAEYVRVRLFVGGVESASSPIDLRAVSGDPLTGVLYRARTTLPAGEYECLAEAGDGFLAALGPATGLTAGPSVTASGSAAASALITSLAVAAEAGRFAEIRFATAATGLASARVLNVAGREVRQLAADRPVAAGVNTLTWDGTSSAGLRAPAGTYLVEVTVRSDSGERHSRLAAFRW